MDVTASGTLTDTSILGGTIPQLAFDAALADDTAHVKANGAFAGFDPAVASGKPEVKGTVGGTLDVDATVADVSRGVTVDSVAGDGEGRRSSRRRSAASSITRANVDGDYHDSTGDIRTLDIVGRDINVQASGTLALNDDRPVEPEGARRHRRASRRSASWSNQPLTGIGKVDATVTGNQQRAAGRPATSPATASSTATTAR